MPNDLVVRPTPPIAPAAPEAAGAPPSAPAKAPAEAAAVGAKSLPNPSMRLDPALGLVVIEFHDEAGGVVRTIPDPRQLDAYRTARNEVAIHPPATRTV